MRKVTTWAVVVAVIAVIVAFVFFNPLANRSTDQQPSPHALDQTQ